MSVADMTKLHRDEPCAGVALDSEDWPPSSRPSSGSMDYSRSQCSCGSLHSNYDYSEDFISPCSNPATNRSYGQKPGVKEKKKYAASKIAQPKGQKDAPSRKQPWPAPGPHPQAGLLARRRDPGALRVLSAHLHKIKELQNELADIHRQLEAVVLENQFLKQLQFRHLKAIGKYENSQSNLPQIMIKHQNEVKNLRQLLRKSQEKGRSVSRKLRETEGELLRTQDALQALQKLSEDKNLGEREELTQKLTALSAEMEANDKKIQGLERQLRLSTRSFKCQLVTENQKTLAAQTATKTLQAEVQRLQQKLKEREHELEIKNIYTNRILRNIRELEEDSKVSSTKSVQADGRSLSFVSMIDQETQKSEDVSTLKTKGTKVIRNIHPKEKSSETNHEVPHNISKLPKQDDSKRKLEDASQEEAYLEVRAAPQRAGRPKEQREDQDRKPLPQERELLPQTVQPGPPDRGGRAGSQDGGEAGTEMVTHCDPLREASEEGADRAGPTARPACRPRKLYTFSEATENLHHGLPACGGPGQDRGVWRHRAAAEPKPEAPDSYELPFGGSALAQAGDPAFQERKSSLMAELFGAGYAQRPEQAAPGPADGGAESPGRKAAPPARASASNAFGDSEATLGSSARPSPPTGEKRVL